MIDALTITGISLFLVGWAGAMVAIYRQSDGWALGSLQLDVVLLFAVCRYWRETRRHALIMLAGVCLIIVAMAFASAAGAP